MRVVALGALAACGPAKEQERPRPRPLDEVKTEELLRLNAMLPSDPALAQAYQAINAQYFDSRLPPIRVRWEPRLAEVGPLIAEDFRLEGVTDGHLILMLPTLQGDGPQLRRVLCHEMVHIALRDRPETHGPAFQGLLRELVGKGAFAGIVATDDEKLEFRRALDARAGELTKELSDLLRARSELEGDAASHQKEIDDLNARTAAASQGQAGGPSESERAAANARLARLQDRSWEFNARVRRYNETVSEFNGLAEHYSLMVSYPDGLDLERVPRRAPLPLRDDGKS